MHGKAWLIKKLFMFMWLLFYQVEEQRFCGLAFGMNPCHVLDAMTEMSPKTSRWVKETCKYHHCMWLLYTYLFVLLPTHFVFWVQKRKYYFERGIIAAFTVFLRKDELNNFSLDLHNYSSSKTSTRVIFFPTAHCWHFQRNWIKCR